MFSSAGIILVGGPGRRRGRYKPHLPLPGNEQVTFVEHLSSLLTAQCSEVVLVARDVAQSTEYCLRGVHTVPDRVPNVGPLMGLYSGLSAIKASHALVTAVDMPFVQPDMIAFLLAQPLEDALLVPVVNGVPQVLLAVYPRSVLPTIEELLR